jgi:DMSO reductase family type II enzyme heme b subunit
MKKNIRIPAFWQAVLILSAAYLLFAYAFPPLMPRALMLQYMGIVAVAVLLYFSFEDRRWVEFKKPLKTVFSQDHFWPARWALLAFIASLAGYMTFNGLTPAYDAPVELRQVHPAPPTTLQVFGKTYDLSTLVNPVRAQVLKTMETSPEQAWIEYQQAVDAGSQVYYQNCFYCHGDLLDGKGMFARSLNPLPANFRDVGTIAQLQEAYLFWRISTGGAGLPKEGAPWNSAMPVWHEMLQEDEVWNVIMFLYDHVEQVPRMWDPEMSKAVSRIQALVREHREQSADGASLFQLHCAACHGNNGEGDGFAAAFVYPKPRDFTTGVFKDKNSPEEALPTDEDIFETIKNGLPGTAMPAWESLLDDAQIRSLIPVLKRMDLVGNWAPSDALDEDFDEEGHYLGELISVTETVSGDGRVLLSDSSLKSGRKAFLANCAQCHGDDGRGNPGVDKRLKDDWGNRIWPRDLTKPWTWRITNAAGTDSSSRDRTIANIFTRLSIGIPGTPMPAHAELLGEEERWNIANYVYTLRDYSPPPVGGQVVKGRFVAGALPQDVNDAAWLQAEPFTLMMLPNIIKEGRLFKPLSDALTVRVVYNADEVAFLLELDDRTYSRPGDPDAEKTQDSTLELFPDAFAIQIPKEHAYSTGPVVEKPLFRHGDAQHPTTIWYWNAGSVEPSQSPYALLLDAAGTDKELQPRHDDTSLEANGEWVNGRWRVLMKRPRQGLAGGDLPLQESHFIPVSFASWDGSNGEVASKHTLSPWYWLLLPRPVDHTKTIGWTIFVVLAVLLVGLGAMRLRRKKSA